MASLGSLLPMGILTDSYKASHFLQYPPCQRMIAYGEFRSGFDRDTEDTRMVVYGIRYLLETYLHRQWTVEDVEKADKFYSTHKAPGFTAFPFPKDLFLDFVHNNNGYFPVKLQALPEGTCVHAHVPVYQITSSGRHAALCTFLEVILTMMWYPTTVATLSRRARDVIEAAFEESVEAGAASPLLSRKPCMVKERSAWYQLLRRYPTTVATLSRRARDVIEAAFEESAEAGAASPLLPSRLHDFGFRGCCTVEQSVIGGAAHLLNFTGTDTLSAAYYVQFQLNGGEPVGASIPATEHSVMTAWATERAAIENMIDRFGDGLFACVMDSYDYMRALSEVLPSVAERKVGRGGFMVLRPDSGDPVEAVLEALRAAEKVFGVDINSKGYKVPRGAGVIQGDGINLTSLSMILSAVLKHGYSAEAVAFGMGGGLLQKVNRDTMSFATKLSHVTYADGTEADIMKSPTGDTGKFSFPGALAVKRVEGVPTVFPAEGGYVSEEEDMLQTVYDCGPVKKEWPLFRELRARIAKEWPALPKKANAVSQPLTDKIQNFKRRRQQ